MAATYVQEKGPEKRPYDKYSKQCIAEFHNLLTKNATEPELQEFFEKNPCLVPGAWTPSAKSGHCPLHCALITQPKLPGLKSRVPDFMWISTHSQTWFPTLIEIERPNKKIFNNSGKVTADFTHARNQLAQWRTWFTDPANVQVFIKEYGIDQSHLSSRTMKLHMILIYGQRAEFEGNPELSKLRASLLTGNDEELISYDRLTPDEALEYAITVKANGSGRYKAVWIPATFATSPMLSDRFCYIQSLEEALDKNPDISKKRKVFLKRRVAYWRTWASESGTRSVGKGRFWE